MQLQAKSIIRKSSGFKRGIDYSYAGAVRDAFIWAVETRLDQYAKKAVSAVASQTGVSLQDMKHRVKVTKPIKSSLDSGGLYAYIWFGANPMPVGKSANRQRWIGRSPRKALSRVAESVDVSRGGFYRQIYSYERRVYTRHADSEQEKEVRGSFDLKRAKLRDIPKLRGRFPVIELHMPMMQHVERAMAEAVDSDDFASAVAKAYALKLRKLHGQ